MTPEDTGMVRTVSLTKIISKLEAENDRLKKLLRELLTAAKQYRGLDCLTDYYPDDCSDLPNKDKCPVCRALLEGK